MLVMGDIHGQYEKMVKVLSLCEYDPAKDRLVLLGDYVDRGPATSRVVKAVMQLVKAGAVALYGNHEDLMLQALNKRQSGRISAAALDQWYANGGEITLNDYRADSTTLEEHLGFFGTLPRWYEEKGYLFVHAGIKPGLPLDRQSREHMIWIRGAFLDSEADHGAVVVHGHTVVHEVEWRSNRIGVDTGAYTTGRLTALVLEGRERRLLQT